MVQTNITFRINNQPLALTYIEQVGALGESIGLYMTDGSGKVTVDVPTPQTRFAPANPDFRIHCQNSVLRVLDGSTLPFPSQIKIPLDQSVTDGMTFDIANKFEHFKILQQSFDIYNTVWRQFRPFNRSSRGAFPFGKRNNLRETINSNPRIELSFPDQSPSTLAWVEPASVATTFPLIHVKSQASDSRLFGDSTHFSTLLPHELSHAFHFALMSFDRRARLEAAYGAWIASRLASGQPASHNTDVKTDPFIAFIEAVGIFSERFFFFRKLVRPELTGVRLRNAFVDDELSSNPSLGRTFLIGDGYVNVNGLTGNDKEGAVYGAIFLDFANRVGLREAVGLYLDSQAFTFSEFENFVKNRGDSTFSSAMDSVKGAWGM